MKATNLNVMSGSDHENYVSARATQRSEAATKNHRRGAKDAEIRREKHRKGPRSKKQNEVLFPTVFSTPTFYPLRFLCVLCASAVIFSFPEKKLFGS